MAIAHFLPKLTRAVPGTLVAIVAVSLVVIGFDLNTRTVGDLASIAGGLPAFHVPAAPVTLQTLWIILPYSLVLAAIGLIESLLTMTLVDELTETRGNGNRVCIGQGVANIFTGLFGGMGGCAMVGQTLINIESGGRKQASGIFAALFLLAFILFGSSLIELIPLGALVGIMFMVVIGTFEWSSLRLFGRVPKADVLVVVLVAAVTVAMDLAVAVLVGVIVSALVFAWEHAKSITAKVHKDAPSATVYELHGPLFFGSVRKFHGLFDSQHDTDDVVVEFQHSKVWDHSGIEAIDALAERYTKAGKTLHLRHLSADCRALLKKAGSLIEVNVIEDPRYRVADDALG